MNKSKRKTNDDSNGSNSLSLELEMSYIAMKAKNSELITANTKLVQVNSELEAQNRYLQAELINKQAKINHLDEIVKNVQADLSKWTPHIINTLNSLLSESNKKSIDVFNLTTISDSGSPPKTKAITHTVKPHTVNGTVLNLVPTISLTRLNTNISAQRLQNGLVASQHIDYRNSEPSTSAVNTNNENFGPDLDDPDEADYSFVSKRKHTKSLPETQMNGLDEDDIETPRHSADESQQNEEGMRLSTILEESACSGFGRKQTLIKEVRISLSRLSPEELNARHPLNSSTEANINDTFLNIEATITENEENAAGETLRADIMVFSPHTNSTRMDGENSPSTGNARKLAFFPTPSLSALGDIDPSQTRLNFWTDSRENTPKLTLTPSSSPANLTSLSPAVTSLRKVRSTKRTLTRSERKDGSPTSSKENQIKQTFVSLRRGTASGDRSLTPIVVLERLTGHEMSSRCSNVSDQPKENETPIKKKVSRSRSKKGVGRSRSKLSKNSSEHQQKMEEESPAVLQGGIQELKIRLSKYLPGTSESSVGSPLNTNSRPKRAARPTTLKDRSLKGKLRRVV